MSYDEAKVNMRLETYLFPALREYYGSVPWLDKPKGEQNPEAIKQTWAKALWDKTGDELTAAVGLLKRNKKSMTCPTLAHILEALKNVPKPILPEAKDEEVKPATTPSEVVRRYVPKGKFYDTYTLTKIANEAMYKRVPEIIGEVAMREIELSYPSRPEMVTGALMEKAEELGLFNDLESYGYSGVKI